MTTRQVTPKKGDVLLLVGTVKGLFTVRAPAARARWDIGGPHFPGQAVYAATYDDRQGRGRLRNVFVGAESIRFTGGLDTPVPDGAEVWILPAVSGG